MASKGTVERSRVRDGVEGALLQLACSFLDGHENSLNIDEISDFVRDMGTGF